MMVKVMLVARLYGKEDLRLEEIQTPSINSNEILVKVKACAICGSDLRNFFKGPSVEHYRLPLIPGHEAFGEIVQVGSEVKGYNLGDNIIIPPLAGCGRCMACISGMENLCPHKTVLGANLDGAFAEYMKIPKSLVEVGLPKIPEGCSFEAALAEPLACALHGAIKAGIGFGEKIIIIGDGPMGLLHLLCAKLMGAFEIVVIGHHERRLQVAKSLGADVTINSLEEDVSKILDTTWEIKSTIIVAVGEPSAITEGLRLLKTAGTLLIFGGCPPGSIVEFDPNFIHYKEICIIGSSDCTIGEFYQSVSLLKKLNLNPLISKKYPLRSIHEAYHCANSKEELKVIITP
jgi:L-iditol 2-dehydrogenase